MLGNQHRLYRGNKNMCGSLDENKDSVLGVGRSKPASSEVCPPTYNYGCLHYRLLNDITAPSSAPSARLKYNEYLIYDEERVKLRYIFQVKFYHFLQAP